MIGIGLLLCVPIVMWLAQSIALRAGGEPIRWRLSNRDAPRGVRVTGRVVTQLALVGVIVGYPIMSGVGVREHYATLLPRDATMSHALRGAAMAIMLLAGLAMVWLACERLEIDVRHSRKRWMRRLALLAPSAVFGGLVEEMVFRGVVQFDLLRVGLAPGVSVAIAAVVFAGAHYVRSTKRKWTIFGHLALGLLLSAAFVATRNLWLATGIHAGGIFMILGGRAFVRYRGPAWLTGESIFPFAGIPGIVGLLLLTIVAVERFAVR